MVIAMIKTVTKTLAALLVMMSTQLTLASDSIDVKNISLELAKDIASESLNICQKQGYQVSVVVVDRNGLIRVALRDDLASRFTLQIAEEKANSVILSGTSSGTLRKNRNDIRAELNHMNGIIIMRGALPIEIAGARIGAIGISGAPGGDKDELCAQQALDKMSDRLDFAE